MPTNDDTILTTERVHHVLDECVRGHLSTHGGELDLLSVEGQCVRIRFLGACRSCMASNESLREQIQEALRQALGCPSLELRVQVGVSDELIAEAKKILQRKS